MSLIERSLMVVNLLAFCCPIAGDIEPVKVLSIADKFVAMGVWPASTFGHHGHGQSGSNSTAVHPTV